MGLHLIYIPLPQTLEQEGSFALTTSKAYLCPRFQYPLAFVGGVPNGSLLKARARHVCLEPDNHPPRSAENIEGGQYEMRRSTLSRHKLRKPARAFVQKLATRCSLAPVLGDNDGVPAASATAVRRSVELAGGRESETSREHDQADQLCIEPTAILFWSNTRPVS